MGSGDGPATANGDPELDAEEGFDDLDELHFWGLPIDLWAQAQVGRITIFYTAGKVIFACAPNFRNVAWDVACDLYLPPGATVKHGVDYVYCESCDREIFYFTL